MEPVFNVKCYIIESQTFTNTVFIGLYFYDDLIISSLEFFDINITMVKQV